VLLWLSVIAYDLENLWRRLFGGMAWRIPVLPLPAGVQAAVDWKSFLALWSAETPHRIESVIQHWPL
jgi:hypothetical protein